MRRLLIGAAAAAGLVSCLPADDRPVPATVTVTVTSDGPLAASGFRMPTVDGWTLAVDRFLLTIGNSGFEDSDTCANYYDPDYRRILDVRVAGPQHLGIAYALGQCDFGFRIAGPEADSLLGASVTDADRTRLGTPGTDAFATNRGVSLYVQGSAANGAVQKTFAWSFRQRARYYGCGTDEEGTHFDLQGGRKSTVDLRVHPETPFLDQVDPSIGRVRFAAIARADDQYGNADGVVTLDELGLVPLSDVQGGGLYQATPSGLSGSDGGTDAGQDGAIPQAGDWGIEAPDGGSAGTLEAFIYVLSFPNVVRLGPEGSCKVHIGDFLFER